jgi:hypothetical protein
MADYPPLNKFYTASYSANDRDFPVVAIRLDPRTAGYRVPEDLSPHPDSKRYPNHVFTGAQPASGDQIVTHIYEILPAPYVPFTRYDDDLGPIQGRRRSVKNEGQVARLGPDQRVNYEAREGSAIVYTEIEESWSVATDDDGNSLFPIRDRDFYDASRGAVQERRQLFVPTGEEEGSLENVNGVITQTSYEPYNEFLSVKIVQTYSVSGPQLIGRATDNDGQLVTVTTQRKAAKDYVSPRPSATRTVEVSREDAESLVERIVDTPNVFDNRQESKQKPDIVPPEFRATLADSTTATTRSGSDTGFSLSSNEVAKTVERITANKIRESVTIRAEGPYPSLQELIVDNDGVVITRSKTLVRGGQSITPSATVSGSVQALGDGFTLKTQDDKPIFVGQVFSVEKPDTIPPEFRAEKPSIVSEKTVAGEVEQPPTLEGKEIAKSEQAITEFLKRVRTTTRDDADTTELLNEEITPQGQKVIVSRQLSKGTQSITPSALVSGNVQALGDQYTLKTENTLDKVFENEVRRRSRPNFTPEKFRFQQVDITKEETKEGEIEKDFFLNNLQLSRSEEQVTKFVKRTTTVERSQNPTAPIKDFVVTQRGQLATREQVLSGGIQEILPSALLIDGSVEALGDGRSVKTEIRVDEVFDEKSYTSERPDFIPAKFRKNTTETIEEKVEAFEEGQFPEEPTPLNREEGEYKKLEQKITEFTQRIVTTKKDDVELEEIESSDYIDTFDVKLPFIEKITDTIPEKITANVQSLGNGKYLVKEYDLEALETELGEFKVIYPTRINLSLPRILKNIEITWQEDEAEGEFENDNEVRGVLRSASVNDRGSVNAELGATPVFNLDIEEIFAQNLRATTVIFFLKNPLTEAGILGKAGEILNQSIQNWPVFKPQGHSFTIIGKKTSGSINLSVSLSWQELWAQNSVFSSAKQKDVSTTINPFILNIPPCINKAFKIRVPNVKPLKVIEAKASVEFYGEGGTIEDTLELKNEVEVDLELKETEPADVPRDGFYLIDSSVEFFKFGWFIVSATIFDANQLAD